MGIYIIGGSNPGKCSDLHADVQIFYFDIEVLWRDKSTVPKRYL